MGKFRDIWDSSKDGDKREQRSFLRYFILSSFVFIVLVGFVNRNNLVRWFRSTVTIRTQRERIEFLQQEIDRIDAQLNSLKNNEDSLETFARQRFLFAEPGDDVYIDD